MDNMDGRVKRQVEGKGGFYWLTGWLVIEGARDDGQCGVEWSGCVVDV